MVKLLVDNRASLSQRTKEVYRYLSALMLVMSKDGEGGGGHTGQEWYITSELLVHLIDSLCNRCT